MTDRPYKQGIDRLAPAQLPLQLEEWVSGDNVVRAIDVFVDCLDLASLGFALMSPNRTAAGQPAYSPVALLKLYMYGYLNRVRSSRVLERECVRNLELIWLMQGLRPSHMTIAAFRKRNPKALRQVHVKFVLFAKHLDLLGGQQVAVDGSHFNGNVSDKSFRSVSGLKQAIEKLDKKIGRWLKQVGTLGHPDREIPPRDGEWAAKLKKLQALKETLEAEIKALEDAGVTHRSVTDPDAKLLNKRGSTTAGYNVQIVVDAKFKLIVADEVVQDANDLHQLHPMLSQAKQMLGVSQIEGLADKGYCNASQIAACERDGIIAYVPEPERGGRQRQGGRFVREDFRHDLETDTYPCPNNQILTKRGEPQRSGGGMLQRYSCSETHCRQCPMKASCITDKTACRDIYRSEH